MWFPVKVLFVMLTVGESPNRLIAPPFAVWAALSVWLFEKVSFVRLTVVGLETCRRSGRRRSR